MEHVNEIVNSVIFNVYARRIMRVQVVNEVLFVIFEKIQRQYFRRF